MGEPRRLRRFLHGRSGTPAIRTSVLILGDRQINTFEALCRVTGREPHQLAADIVLHAIRDAQTDHEIQHDVALHAEDAEP